MKTLTLAALLTLTGLSAQEPPRTASEEAKQTRVEAITDASKRGIAISAVAGAVLSPAKGLTNLATGLLGMEIRKQIAGSPWVTTMTQKYASKYIAEYLTKRDKELWVAGNSKVDGKVILTLTSKAMTKEKADQTIKEEPLEKWRKCGWDYLVFANDTETWAYSTDGK
jgi:hypothetical protein